MSTDCPGDGGHEMKILEAAVREMGEHRFQFIFCFQEADLKNWRLFNGGHRLPLAEENNYFFCICFKTVFHGKHTKKALNNKNITPVSVLTSEHEKEVQIFHSEEGS